MDRAIANFRLPIADCELPNFLCGARHESALSVEPVFEVQIENNAEEEKPREADGNDIIVNLDFRHAHASYTPDTTLGSKALRGQSAIGNGNWHLLDTLSACAL
jgi:hypothetical protein